MSKQTVVNKELKKDAEFTWQLFEKTGSIGAFLVYHETRKNISVFEKAKDSLYRDIFDKDPVDNN